MKRFPSKHGAKVAFDPLRSAAPPPLKHVAVPRAASIPRELVQDTARARSPSFVEVDVVEANLTGDPRYDRD